MNYPQATAKNLGISVAVYSVLLLLLWLAEMLIPALQGRLLHFDDAAWCVGIPTSIVGVCYILTVRDPKNYTGFYAAILMSLLISVQYLLQKNYDLVAATLLISLPLQIKALIQWKKGKGKTKEVENVSERFVPCSDRFVPCSERELGGSPEHSDLESTPTFLSPKAKLITLLVFIAICALDYLQITYISKTDSSVMLKIFSSMLFASQIVANFWIIYRKIDNWYYWLLYSVAGLVFFALIGNAFSVVLFCFFLVVNTMACKSWVTYAKKV